MREYMPAIKFQRNSDGVTLVDGVEGRLSSIIDIKIKKGLGVFIPGTFPLTLKLSEAVHENSEIFWGYSTPADPRRIVGIGNSLLYQPFKDLTIPQQQHRDWREIIMADMGLRPGLGLIEDETFHVQIFTPTGVAASADTMFQIPYYERRPADLVAELELRRILYGS